MPTQAQEIDGHVLINDLGDLAADSLRPGDLVEVEITESHTHDVLGRVTRVISPSRVPTGEVTATGLATAATEWRGSSHELAGLAGHA